MITIGKYYFESLEEWLSWRKIKISDFSFGIIVDMKILLEFFPIAPIYTLSNMQKQLWLGSPVRSYGTSEARVFA